jgi:glycogen debranching enzyme
MRNDPISEAQRLLEDSIIYFQEQPVGTVAANDPENLSAANYSECFVRDFMVSALVFLNQGRYEIVHNFLLSVVRLRTQQRAMEGHYVQPGVMPASFRVDQDEDGLETLRADFGEHAIGRVAPVDSMMWWVILLNAYQQASGDQTLAARQDVQHTLRLILELCLRDSFEVFPTLLVPDGAFMIDRRLGVYGHPLEIQALFYGTLRAAVALLSTQDGDIRLIKTAIKRAQALRSYVRIYYWLDGRRLNEIHRFGTEQFGAVNTNMLNIYPESIPHWVTDWLPRKGGYLVGNLGPGRMDFRFFAQGNLLAILFDLTTEKEAAGIMDVYEARWDDLIGMMPAKLVYPAVEGIEWKLRTGSDPKNVPWSYHNGGNWPMLLWAFVAAALKAGRPRLARRAYRIAYRRLQGDRWPEYYDGRNGRLIGRRSNFYQVWTAAGLLFARQLLKDPSGVDALVPR